MTLAAIIISYGVKNAVKMLMIDLNSSFGFIGASILQYFASQSYQKWKREQRIPAEPCIFCIFSKINVIFSSTIKYTKSIVWIKIFKNKQMSPIEIEFEMLVGTIQEKNNPLMMQYFNTLIIDHPV